MIFASDKRPSLGQKNIVVTLDGFLLILLSSLISQFNATEVSAQDGNCYSRIVGERCYQIYRLDPGPSGSTRDTRDESVTKPVQEGYVVVSYDEINESSNGGLFTVNATTRGQRTDIRRQWSAQSTRIANLEQKLDMLYKDSDGERKAKLDTLNRELDELKSATNYVNTTDSNIDIFELRARSKYVCKITTALGCADGYGNHGKGYVKANLVYVGSNPSTKVDYVQNQLLLIEQTSVETRSRGAIIDMRDIKDQPNSPSSPSSPSNFELRRENKHRPPSDSWNPNSM